jgi:hypothetical protein
VSWEVGLSRAILVLVSVFYAYGAFIHVGNLSVGFASEIRPLPPKWLVLETVYTCLSVLVAGGLLLRARLAVAAFFVTALSQIVLYTSLRDWVTDLPEPFRPGPAQIEGYARLVSFHLLSLPLVALALWLAVEARRR